VPDPRSAVRAVVAAAVVAACSVLSPPDPRLCSAAQNLSAAVALTATAIQAEAASDVARAQGLATQARSVSELAYDTIKGMPDDRKTDPVWQRLQSAYLATAQADQSLLPAFGGSPDMAPAQLADAQVAMGKVRAELPEMCFALPGDLETPAAS
jgi:hypothetical protein